jgi:hypothetical protein
MGIRNIVSGIVTAVTKSLRPDSDDAITKVDPTFEIIPLERIQVFQQDTYPNVTLQRINSGPHERWRVEYWATTKEGMVISYKSQTANCLHWGLAMYNYQCAKGV